MSEDDVSASDALAIAQRALAKANRVDELEAEIDELEEELARQSLRLSEFDDGRDYRDLTRDDKIGMVREHAFQRATDANGRAALDYSDIRWGVFDGEPGAAHCYDLMRAAADVRGFEVRNPGDGNKHLAVDAEQAKHAPGLFPEKKDGSGEVA